jgi:tetratricopeptide (TPR) repeat protein
VVQERNVGSRNECSELQVESNTPSEWFKIACYLASRGKQIEAEVAIKKALNIQEEFPIAWAIYSAILLSQGKETDAEQAGKKAILQCQSLIMTWPKMRGIIFSRGIIRGSSWKDPRRVVIEDSNASEWGKLLGTLGKASNQDIEEISSDQTTFENKEELQSRSDSLKEFTPKREIDVTEKKGYESTRKTYRSYKEREDEVQSEAKSMKTYPSVRKIDRTKKRYESAEERFEQPQKHVDRKPVNDEQASVLFTAAEVHLKQGDVDAAEEAFLKALKLDPSRGEAWFMVSSILAGKQKYSEAIQALEYATQKMPKNASAWYQLGYCYQKLNKWADSIPPLRQATVLDKVKPEFWMALGLSEFYVGQYQYAAKSLLRVLRMNPNHKNALFYLAKCMEKQGNRKHSLSLYLKLMNIGGLKPQMLEQMAGALERLNRPSEARECRRQAQIAHRAGVH